ncbi:right-handed parallel beta-helix repeat-containing protein, partial [Candidatus Woesearchaeota archaeon]|nr:right-handed parallel beta-helix repeat-containing protein [Candidatus Woesearchaeota archaeon]
MLKTEVKKQLLVLLVIFIFLFIGAVFLIDKGNLNLTGFAVTDSYNYPVNKLFSENSYIDLQLATVPASISISGAVQGLGTIQVYANDGTSRSLIFDKQVLNLPTTLTEDELLDLQQFSSTCLDSCSHAFATNNIRLEIEVQDASLYIEDVIYSETPQEQTAPIPEPETVPEPEPVIEEFEVQTEPVVVPVVEAAQTVIEIPNKVQSNERFFYGNERLFDKEAVKNIAFKTKDDPEFDVIFEDLIRTASDVTIKFHHDSAINQPVVITGITDYTLSTTNAAPGETVELNVPLVELVLPEFTLRVGAQSEEFDFGEGFEAQTDVIACPYSAIANGEVINIVGNLLGDNCIDVTGFDAVTIAFNNNFISSAPYNGIPARVVTISNAANTNLIGNGLIEGAGGDIGLEITGSSTNTIINDVDITSEDANAISGVGSITITDGSVTSSGTGIPVSVTGAATSFTFDGNDATDDKIEGTSNNDLIELPAGSTAVFTDFVFDGNSVSEGIELDGTITLTDGKIEETKPDDDSPPPPPLRLNSGPIHLDDIQISDNNIYLGNAIEVVDVSGGSGTGLRTPPGQNGKCGLKVTATSDVIFGDVITDCANIDPSFNITIENSTFANATNCVLIDNSNVTLVNNNNISNCQVGVNITNASKHNVVKNNTIYNISIGVGIYNASWNNTVYYNNITNGTRTLIALAQDLTGYGDNSFNTTVASIPHGNLWADIGLYDIYDINSDGFGDYGSEYPYGMQSDGVTTYGNVSGNVTDWGPMNPQGNTIAACGTISSNTVLIANLTTISSCFIINANGITLDCNGNSITGNGPGSGIVINSQTGITIKNCTISNFVHGINLTNTNSNKFLQNTIYNNQFGIYSFDGSAINEYDRNYIGDCPNGSIYIDPAAGGSIASDNLTNNFINNSNFTAVYTAQGMTNTRFINNTIRNTSLYGVLVQSSASGNLFENNTFIDNNQTAIRIDTQSTNSNYIRNSIGSGGGGISINDISNNLIMHNSMGFNAFPGGNGISISGGTIVNVTIQNNTMNYNNFPGGGMIALSGGGGSGFINVSFNTIMNNIGPGINYGDVLIGEIYNNTIGNNTEGGLIQASGSGVNAYIHHNIIENNTGSGLSFSGGGGAQYSNITHNTIRFNTADGIRFDDGANNNIRNNILANNSDDGINLDGNVVNNTMSNNLMENNTNFGVNLETDSNNNELFNEFSNNNGQGDIRVDNSNET